MKPKVIAIVGPTASGKSALGLFLAHKLRGEIVSADSRQVYKGMKIISRSPSKKELAAAPHHLFAYKNPVRAFSAGAYQKEAAKTLERIFKKQRVPVVVGGTGFYADSLLRGLSLPQVAPNKILRAQLAKKTPKELLAELKKIDPKSAKRIDANNIVRLVRAIEVARAVGPIPNLSYNSAYDVLWLGIAPAAKKHARAIEKGIEERLHAGMVVEARKLRKKLSKKRFLELGFEFQLLADFIDKKISKKELVEGIIRGEQKYAKRQMRWFRRNKDIVWITSSAEALKRATKFLNKK